MYSPDFFHAFSNSNQIFNPDHVPINDEVSSYSLKICRFIVLKSLSMYKEVFKNVLNVRTENTFY